MPATTDPPSVRHDRRRSWSSCAAVALVATLMLAAACGDTDDTATPAPTELSAVTPSGAPDPEPEVPAEVTWRSLGDVTPARSVQFALIDYTRIAGSIGTYPGGSALDPPGDMWLRDLVEDTGAPALPLPLRRAFSRLDDDEWERFLGAHLADAQLAISTEGPGDQVSVVRFGSIDVAATLESVGWQAAESGYVSADDTAVVIDDTTVQFGAVPTETLVITDSPGVAELLDSLDDIGIHVGIAFTAPEPFANRDDPLPVRLVDFVGGRGSGASAEAVTVAVYGDEADADAAADGIERRIAAMTADELYADSSVSVDGRVVVVVTPAADTPGRWRQLRNLLLVETLLD